MRMDDVDFFVFDDSGEKTDRLRCRAGAVIALRSEDRHAAFLQLALEGTTRFAGAHDMTRTIVGGRDQVENHDLGALPFEVVDEVKDVHPSALQWLRSRPI